MTEAKEQIQEGLPPEVYPYRYQFRDDQGNKDLNLEQEYFLNYFHWYQERYKDKTPAEWWSRDGGSFPIENWVDQKVKRGGGLAGDEVLQEAIAALPRQLGPFMIMAEYTRLSSAQVLALGIVNALAVEGAYEWDEEQIMRNRETVFWRQERLGMSQEEIEEARKLVALWESQLKPFTWEEARQQDPQS